ncbi:MAG: hypothetical protein V1722_02845 [Candidatus Micrarchaeota archaeon]
MLTIFHTQECIEIAKAVAAGAASVELKLTTNASELQTLSVICIAKQVLGGELKTIAPQLHEKTIYLVGVGFSFQEMQKLIEELQKQNVNVENTLCLKRAPSLLPIGAKVTEVELSRAKAFGERIASRLTGIQNRPDNEKNRIKNYNK